MAVSRRVVLHFANDIVGQSIVCRLAKDMNLEFNILRAHVTPEEEGLLVMELSGDAKDYEVGMRYLAKMGVVVQSLNQDVVRDEVKCTHCGSCITICPAKAFTVDAVSRKVAFAGDKCVACELCIKACPARAMETRF
jgi:ferredoxin